MPISPLQLMLTIDEDQACCDFSKHPLMEDITLAGTDLAFSAQTTKGAQSKWKRYRREKDTVKGCDAIAECGSTQDDELFWQVFGTINAQVGPSPMKTRVKKISHNRNKSCD
ncbi:hypothetical protein BLNAU_16146 [Blattamonas nauphoetae]|uniref:Uncharacterized protein n=1 Tax=Blattamonas nauphoetae TaxID=2049346 RepID=A0ABQ9X8Y0_9EUKA|nr:hypothetical protein BLNAU_16146 [Blattamonas nauphoetae]